MEKVWLLEGLKTPEGKEDEKHRLSELHSSPRLL